MNIRAFGVDYYLDEKAFAERMTAPAPNWKMGDIIEIQHQLKSSEDRIMGHMRQTALPDPLESLRRHLDDLITADSAAIVKEEED